MVYCALRLPRTDMNQKRTDRMIMKRRNVLGVGAFGLAAAAIGLCPSAVFAQQSAIDQNGFLKLSELLTGRASLDMTISARAFAALSAEDAAFPAAALTLSNALQTAGLTDMRGFKDFAAAHADLAPTAMKIISAWYLGYTGRPEGEANHDDARFVAYAGALMYEPTKDVTIVPTYARGHTNYWVNPPKSLATD
jgi:fructose 5-dehydrogenase small subunit